MGDGLGGLAEDGAGAIGGLPALFDFLEELLGFLVPVIVWLWGRGGVFFVAGLIDFLP